MSIVPRKNTANFKRLVAVIIVLLAVAAFGALEIAGVTHVFRKKAPAVTSAKSFNSKGEPKTNSSTESTNTPGTVSDKTTGSTLPLLTPSGDFVSNHHPNLSGSPAPNTMTSVCNTTPGASCKIIFTKGGATKSLPDQTADPNGFTNWDWKLQDIGLTEGTWKVQAIASLNGQTKSAADAMDLVVAQ
jgi:hypothetical protein